MLEHYKLSPKDTKELPSSERHRLIKIKEEFIRNAGKSTSDSYTTMPTGLTATPTRTQRTIPVGYRAP